MTDPSSFWDFSASAIDGTNVPMAEYRGKAVLVVNTASQCGLTPQYSGLQELQNTYGERGLVILGFPCDQFGNQEPGDNEEIATFCESSFGVTFPMFAKIDVNGSDVHPLWAWLKKERSGVLGGAIKWNFTKFLVSPEGTVVKRFAPPTEPAKLADDIESLLAV